MCCLHSNHKSKRQVKPMLSAPHLSSQQTFSNCFYCCIPHVTNGESGDICKDGTHFRSHNYGKKYSQTCVLSSPRDSKQTKQMQLPPRNHHYRDFNATHNLEPCYMNPKLSSTRDKVPIILEQNYAPQPRAL